MKCPTNSGSHWESKPLEAQSYWSIFGLENVNLNLAQHGYGDPSKHCPLSHPPHDHKEHQMMTSTHCQRAIDKKLFMIQIWHSGLPEICLP